MKMHTDTCSRLNSPALTRHAEPAYVPLAGRLVSASRKWFLCCLFLSGIFSSTNTFAQVVWENPRYEVYQFLSRQAQKGNIRVDDFIQPLSRKEIAGHLKFLRDSISGLTPTETSELEFYLKEYSEFDAADSFEFLKKDPAGRLRFISLAKNGFVLRGEPVLSLETTQAQGVNIFKRGNGLQFWGQAGKHFGFQFYFQDFSEKGNGLDSLKDFTPDKGIVRTNTVNPELLTYSEIQGHVSYSWKNGSVSVGKDNLLWGYGQNGRMILSDKAPSYPFIRLDYQPLKWLKFQYAHAWLQSGLIDSNRTYTTGNSVYGGEREFYIQKFMATHSLSFFPIKGLAFSIGESMVYSDRLDVGYLIPVMFFKAYDHYSSRHNIAAGSNGQFYFQASSRDHIPNTHIYASLFIDEIRTSAIFNRQKSRNQLGYTIGASTTDIGIPYLSIGLEYSRINPFVYQNLIEAQSYRNQNSILGDWMGNNADRFLGFISYTPIPRLKTRIQWQQVRKGAAGTVEDQYYAEPQPPFLFGLYRKQTETQLSASYQFVHNVYLNGRLTWLKDEDVTNANTLNNTIFRFGLSVGL